MKIWGYIRVHGYNTYAIGKWHLTPAEQTSAAGPYDRWPLGRGFERFYGFLGGETHQYYPELVHDNHLVVPPKTPKEGYTLNEDLTDKAIQFIANAKQVAPGKPFFMSGVGALSGAFWGMLFGLIFFIPIFGMVVGATLGALTGSMADVGISDDFIRSVRSKVTEGTSALFLMTSDAVQDKVSEAARGMKFELIASNLSKEEENKLREAFAEEEAASAY